MSATKKSSKPSRFTSATSIAMEDILIFRQTKGETARKRRPPSLKQNASGESRKSLQIYRSRAPSPLKSRNITDRAQSRGGWVSAAPAASANNPPVQDTAEKRPRPSLR